MFFDSLWRRLRSRSGKSALTQRVPSRKSGLRSSRSRSYRPLIDILEARTVPSFVSAANYAAGSFPYSVAVGDFDGDGSPDLAVANIGSNTVSVFLGTGDGTFRAARNYAAGPDPLCVAVG